MPELHYNTVTPSLLEILKKCMEAPLFDPFRLVGGTALSLLSGWHQTSRHQGNYCHENGFDHEEWMQKGFLGYP